MRRKSLKALVGTAVFLGAFAGPVRSEGDRGAYAGFGIRHTEVADAQPLQSASAPIRMTAYRSSDEKADRFQTVEEMASVLFQLEGLPDTVGAEDYEVRWIFDQTRQSADRRTLRPHEPNALSVRYDTNDNNRRVIRLRVASLDGRWSGETTFPVFGRRDTSPNVNDQNVLLVQMTQVQQ